MPTNLSKERGQSSPPRRSIKMIRKARIKDVKQMQAVINKYAGKDILLPRSLNYIYENLRDFFVYEEGSKILGTCSLHVTWEDLAEVKSLAVDEKKHRHGIGALLLHTCMCEAKSLGIRRLFVLTYIPDFFKKHGFKKINKDKLPHKIWGECISCVKFPDCCEVPLMLELK